MAVVYQIHSIFGERILPLLIVIAAIWFTVAWKPNAPRNLPARLFPVLVDIQAGLGIIIWVFGLINGRADYLQFPFILHPIFGLLAAGLGHMAVGRRNPLSNLGRWAPLATLGLLLVLVISNVLIATAGGQPAS